MIVGKVYACLNEKPYKHAIYLGSIDGLYMFAGRRYNKWESDHLIERLYESKSDFDARKKGNRYCYDNFGIYHEYMKIRCYKNLPDMYKESILHDDDIVDIWYEKRDSKGKTDKISVCDWAYQYFNDTGTKGILNQSVYMQIKRPVDD